MAQNLRTNCPIHTSATGLRYVLVDLGASYTLNKVVVWHYNGDSRTYHNTKTLAMATPSPVSADGVNWTTIYDSAVSGEYPETDAGKTITFTAQSVRYIRDYVNGSTANTGNHWVEIQGWENGDEYIAGTTAFTNGLTWLFQDHLGSTSVSQPAVGGTAVTQLYKAWGESRWSSASLPTKYTYTGQRDDGQGLKYYVARHYDSALGRFTSADTDVPESQGVQGLNRYAYVNNAPTRWTDPTGHNADCGIGDQVGCEQGKKVVEAPKGTSLPTHIKDIRILKAWVLLYNSEAGRKYAELIRDEEITIGWGDDMGNTAGRVTKGKDSNGNWTIKPGSPITLNSDHASAESLFLTTTIAHEAFHYSQQFGQVDTSLYEEFRAFELEDSIWRENGVQLAPSPHDYNPYNQSELELFFKRQKDTSYSKYYDNYLAEILPAYPSSWEDTGHGR